MVPDGVVPTALLAFIEGIGVRRGEVTATAAKLVAERCEAVHWAELTINSLNSKQLEKTKRLKRLKENKAFKSARRCFHACGSFLGVWPGGS